MGSFLLKTRDYIARKNKLRDINRQFPGMIAHSVQLCTVQKSGTNYLRFLISNYINSTFLGENEGVHYDLMHSEFFPYAKDFIDNPGEVVSRNKARAVLGGVGLSIFMYQHGASKFGSGVGKIIRLYRNPLDQMISMYHYHRLKYTDIPIGSVSDELVRKYATVYKSVMSSRSEDGYSVTYENLVRNPRVVLSGVVDFIGFPVNEESIDRSVELSSKNAVKALEEKRGKPIHMSRHMPSQQSFVRDGSIGQWKDVFDRKDLQAIEASLRKNGLNLFSFDLG